MKKKKKKLKYFLRFFYRMNGNYHNVWMKNKKKMENYINFVELFLWNARDRRNI
jgi:hypothetical protein